MAELPATQADLAPFEGHAVRQAGIEIPGAAGGLREAMKIDPQEFHQAEKVFVVLECAVQKVRFDPIDKTAAGGDQRRVHVFDVEAATIVDEDLVRRHLDEQAERIQLAKEAAAGVERLPYGDELQDAHAEGEHADGLVEGCPDCEHEQELAAAEEAESI